MAKIQELANIDLFFFYDEGLSLTLENDHDIMEGVLQPKRTMYYYRTYGCDVAVRENAPNTIALQVGVRFDITDFAAKRNLVVSDGSDNTVDRRCAVSFNSINVVKHDNGELDINVYYIPFADFKNIKNVSIPIGKTD